MQRPIIQFPKIKRKYKPHEMAFTWMFIGSVIALVGGLIGLGYPFVMSTLQLANILGTVAVYILLSNERGEQ